MDACIEWDRCLDGYGYGKEWVNGRYQRAHRMAYCRHHGVTLESIKGLHVRHKCDNRPCVNPLHLEIGTNADNMRDKVERGRQTRGESHGTSKLTETMVKEILALYRPFSREFGTYALSKRFGVGPEAIRRIVNGNRWSHIDGEHPRSARRVAGLKGAAWQKSSGKWRSRITINGKQLDLGLFGTAKEAHEAYMSAKKDQGGLS